MKTCNVCKVPKPQAEFHKDRTARDGLQGRCKACTVISNAKRYAADPLKRNEASRARYARVGKAGNVDRYAKYRDQYLVRRDVDLTSVRGRLYGVFSIARARSVKLEREFTITLDWVLDRWLSIQGRCEMTDIPMTLTRNPPGKRFLNPFNPSLDRRDNREGYTPDNTRIVCVAVNIGKNHFTDEAYFQICCAIAARHPGFDLI